jgi:hypothetical protein
LGDRIFLTFGDQQRSAGDAQEGLYFGEPRKHPHRRASLDGLRHRLEDGQDRLGARSSSWIAAQLASPKEHLRFETPVSDGERVYAYFGNLGLFVFDMEGKPVWSEHWGPFRTRYGWGTAASPVLYKERVMVNDNDDQSFLAALDKRTGKQIWRARDEASNWSDAFYLGKRAARKLSPRHAQSAGVRSGRQSAVELGGCRPS